MLGGSAAIESAAKAAGHDITVPFTPGRTDASQDDTDVESFQWLEPNYDGFRNYVKKHGSVPSEHHLIDKAFMLNLTAPEMTALLGGLRVLGNNVGDEGYGVFTDRPGQLTNDFFVNLLDMGTVWSAVGEEEDVFEGRDRASGDAEVDGHPRRPRLRRQQPAPGDRRGVRLGRRRGPDARRIRPRLGQGDGERPLRPELTRPAEVATLVATSATFGSAIGSSVRRVSALRRGHACGEALVSARLTIARAIRAKIAQWNGSIAYQ